MRHVFTRLFNVAPSLQWRCINCDRTFRRCGGPTDSERLRCDHCYPDTAEGNQAWQQAFASFSPLITRRPRIFAPERALLDEIIAQKARGRRCIVFVSQTDTRDIVPRLLAVRTARHQGAPLRRAAPQAPRLPRGC